MTTSKEDVELIDRLRNKYSNQRVQSSTPQGTEQVADLPSFGGADSLAHVHLCPICHGSGYKQEVYHFRRMQSNCEHCQGEGILTSGTTVARKSSEQSNNDVKGDSTSNHQERSDTTAASDKNLKSGRRQLERQLSRIQQKLAELKQEHADLQAAMVTEDPSSDKRTLQQQLLDQLQQHIKHLQELQKHKQADLTAAE